MTSFKTSRHRLTKPSLPNDVNFLIFLDFFRFNVPYRTNIWKHREISGTFADTVVNFFTFYQVTSTDLRLFDSHCIIIDPMKCVRNDFLVLHYCYKY